MILSEYERKDSPMIWIQYGQDYEDRRYLRTTIRKNDPDKKRKIRAELRRIEAQLLPIAEVSERNGAYRDGWRWVAGYLATRYANKQRTAQVYLAQWRSLRAFLDEKEIDSPAMLTREIVFEYPDWRCSQVKQKSRRNPKINTAIGELKLLGLVMDEAIRRKLANENPARSLGIVPELGELKPELTDAQIDLVFRELAKEGKNKGWMRKSFELALNTGLRFNETRLHRSQVRQMNADIVIEKPKGGRKREFAIPIYDSIRSVIDEFVESGREYFWTTPASTLTGLAWSNFMERIGLKALGITFHSTRITFITRGMRAGIPESVMMKMVNHADKDVSRIYQRWTSEDVKRYADRAASLYGSGGRSGNRHKRPSR
jgi:site-specific recombinase XerD